MSERPRSFTHRTREDAALSNPGGISTRAKRVLVEWAEALLLRVNLPPAPDDAQAGHDWDGKVNTQHTSNLSRPPEHRKSLLADAIPCALP